MDLETAKVELGEGNDKRSELSRWKWVWSQLDLRRQKEEKEFAAFDNPTIKEAAENRLAEGGGRNKRQSQERKLRRKMRPKR
jgi:hypothetical protein